MLKNAGKDVPASPETEQLLADTHHDTSNPCMRLQSGTRCQGDISSSRLMSQDKFPRLDRNTQIGEASSDLIAVIASPSIIVNDNQDNDDPPPYTAIPPPYSAVTPPNHVGWPYGLFSFSDLYSPDRETCRVEIPLTPFQASLPATAFHLEEIDGQHASHPMPLTPYRFKFDSYMPRAKSLSDNEIAEKVDDTKSRRYGAILAAAAVIIFLMALSLMVRFVMERTWRK
ncbi:uncharacterized protein [Linepithema humile]|uniref:uncharacterized protein isoform X2 n=1 Tax=Linepithema humile TaxID=83485 RepID=UPI0006237BA2|nr:PREDICTED: uncharacterized protein LOC105678059 isoform X2 [Linepithema humile]